MSVYEKILKVMEKVEYLQKDGKVQYNSTNYSYLSEEKITTEVRKALIEEKLIILPIESSQTVIDNKTLVSMKYKIIDAETGEHEIISVEGQGADSQDKGVAKAMTMAYKYMQRQTFAIPSGDDPDHTSSAELDDTQKPQKPNKPATQKPGNLNTIKAKYQALYGDMDGFEDFMKEQQQKGFAEHQTDKYLTVQLNNKKQKKGA